VAVASAGPYANHLHLAPERWWRGGAMGKAFGLAISRSRVRILLEATLRK